jgi:hypothetical protein
MDGRNWLHIVIGIILAATVVRTWLVPTRWTPVATAQIPNAGDQRREQVRQAERTNELLSEILSTLKTRTLKVAVQGTDNTKAEGGRSRVSDTGRDR